MKLRQALMVPMLMLCPGLRAGEPITYDQLTALPQPPAVVPIPYGPEALQFGELRMPSGAGPFPVVIVIHGGCWFAEYDLAHIRPLAQAITDLGFATWTLEYRRVGDAGGAWPGTFTDVADGSDFLRRLAAEQPLDLQHVIALGHSAGGQLALWLATRNRLAADHVLYREQPLPLNAVVGLAAAADMVWMAEQGTCDEAASKVLQGMPAAVPERYQAVSPHLRVPLGVPQVLITGAQDSTWTPVAGRYEQAARAGGDQPRSIVVKNAGHFDLVAPQPPVWPELRRALEQLRRLPAASPAAPSRP